MPYQGVKNSISNENPLLPSIDRLKRLDDFFKKLLEEKKKKLVLEVNEIMEKVQQKPKEETIVIKENQQEITLEEIVW